MTSAGEQEWPLQKDHIRIRESQIGQWIRGMLHVKRRQWLAGYLTLELQKCIDESADDTNHCDVSTALGRNHAIGPGQLSATDSCSTVRTPLVSVVIPCYNHGRFLADAIRSVQAQIYRAFEIIVVDDGSNDNTAEIASAWPEVKYLRQPNEGLGSARNRGLAASRGAFLIFLDADDSLLPNALATGCEALNAHPDCAFVYGHCTLVTDSGVPLFHPGQMPVKEDHYYHLLQRCFVWTPGTVMFRRSALDKLGPFDASVGPTADYEMYLRAARSFSILCHDQTVLQYRQHRANMSKNCELMLDSVLPVLYRQWDFVKDNPRLKRAWKTGIRRYHLFYSDPFVLEARRRSAERLVFIESLLEKEDHPARRKRLIDEWRNAYSVPNEAFEIRCNCAPTGTNEEKPKGRSASETQIKENLGELLKSPGSPTSPPDESAQALSEHVEQLYAERDSARKEAAELQSRLLETDAQLHTIRGKWEDLIKYLKNEAPKGSSFSADLDSQVQDIEFRWQLVCDVRRAILELVPSGAVVIVVSKGDDELLQIPGRTIQHFPHRGNGNYTGHHPADSNEAIEHLEKARARGAEYFVIPKTYLWWLEHYRDFGEHLAANYSPPLNQDTVQIYNVKNRLTPE
jgi:glycosyltransferase involved in cell wall biosynthesis